MIVGWLKKFRSWNQERLRYKFRRTVLFAIFRKLVDGEPNRYQRKLLEALLKEKPFQEMGGSGHGRTSCRLAYALLKAGEGKKILLVSASKEESRRCQLWLQDKFIFDRAVDGQIFRGPGSIRFTSVRSMDVDIRGRQIDETIFD